MVRQRSGGAPVADVLEQLDRATEQATIMIDAQSLQFTELSRVLWCSADRHGITKRDVLRYLVQVSPFLLRHLRDRPVEITLCPDGIDGESFFGHDGSELPSFARTVEVWSADRDHLATHLLVPDLVTLLWLGERCAVELFPWLARIGMPPDPTSGLWYPDFLVVNLDWRRTVRDGNDGDAMTDQHAFRRVADVAFDLRSVANALGMRSFVKTSGRRGLHCFLPLDRRLHYSEVKIMAETIGQFLLAVRPRSSTRTMRLLAQSGFISIDHHQSTWGKVLVAPYSLRRHPQATVSTPLEWDELATANPSQFTIHTVPDLLASRGDPWAELLSPVESEAVARPSENPVAAIDFGRRRRGSQTSGEALVLPSVRSGPPSLAVG